MVHGTYYGIQYEIHLTKDLDFYDDLLPIWMEVRARIEMEKDKYSGKYKLIVIPCKQFDKQLYNNSLFNKYIKQNNEQSFCSEYKTEQELISKKFVMITHYNRYVKHNSDLPEPISEQEYKLLLESWQQIYNKLNENAGIINGLSNKEWNELETERTDLFNRLKVQRIIHNSDYFQEIKNLEKELTEQVTLSEEQSALIQKILSHSNLQGLISWHGLTLVDGFY
jgi:hypothetical protein